MNDELLNCFLRPDASVTEWGSNLLFKSLFSKTDSRQCKVDSYKWLRSVNAVYFSNRRVSRSVLTSGSDLSRKFLGGHNIRFHGVLRQCIAYFRLATAA